MRLTILGGLSLALLLLVPSGAAHVGAVEVGASPSAEESAQALEDPLCVPVCGIQNTRLGNAPPATVVESGGTITWTIAEGSVHTATSDRLPGDLVTTVVHGQSTEGDVCLDVGIFGPTTATFRIHDGMLQATPGDGTDPSWSTCDEAVPLEDGGFALTYHCNIHPRFQHGVIHVVPAA